MYVKVQTKYLRTTRFRKTPFFVSIGCFIKNGSKIEHYCVKMHYVGKRKARQAGKLQKIPSRMFFQVEAVLGSGFRVMMTLQKSEQKLWD